MEYVKEEREISVKEMFSYVLFNWKRVLGITIAVVLIVVIINIFDTVKYASIFGIVPVIKVLLKSCAIYGILSGGLCVFYYAVTFLFTDKIKSVNDFSNATNIPVIAYTPNKTQNGKIDRFIKKIFGVKVQANKYKEYENYVVKAIELELISKNVNVEQVVIITSANSLEIQEIVDAMNENTNSNIAFLNAGDISGSADAIDKVMKTDYVVLVEKQGESKYSELKRTCKKLTAWNKNILGAVITNVDAI